MKYYYLTFRSVTFAQQGERILQKDGIHCILQRTPKWMEERGCGYCLKCRSEDIRPALRTLQKAKVSVRKVYVQNKDGQLEEWTV